MFGENSLSGLFNFLKFAVIVVSIFIPVLIISNAVSRYCDLRANNEQIEASSWMVMVEDSLGNRATYQINPYSDKEMSVHTDGGVIVIISPVGSELGAESTESDLDGSVIVDIGDEPIN